MTARIRALNRNLEHASSRQRESRLRRLQGLGVEGFAVVPASLNENITTEGLDLLGLPVGTRLALGAGAVVEITGLRNPGQQLEKVQKGLLPAVVDRDDAGRLIRRAGVMAIIVEGGEIREGDAIRLRLPPARQRVLEPV